jgi:hypothetical protein
MGAGARFVLTSPGKQDIGFLHPTRRMLISTQVVERLLRLLGVPLVLLALTGPISAQQTSGPTEARSPILDGLVLFSVGESPQGREPADPVVTLNIATERSQSCLLALHGDLATTDTSVTVSWIGIPRSQEVCAQMVGPATGSVSLGLRPGKYALRLGSRDTTDTYQLTVATKAIEVRGDGRVTRPTYRTFWRYPARSLAIYCGSVSSRPEMCPRLYAWLARRDSLTEFEFPSGGQLPFPGPITMYQVNAGPRFYRLAAGTTLDALVREIDEWQRGGGWTGSGNGVIVRSWLGELASTPVKVEGGKR